MRTTPLVPGASAGASGRTVRALAVLVAVGALLLCVVAPAAAKEFLEARLEAPISFQSPPGGELEVAVVLTVPDGDVEHLVDGSPLWLRLIGPDGDTTEAPGTMAAAGRYVMHIDVPDGGPQRLELYLRGAEGFPIFLTEDPFTFRPIGAGTAQLAPGPVAAATTAPAAASSAPVANAQAPAPAAADPTVAPVTSSEVHPWLLPVAAIATLAVIAIVVVALASRVRSHRGFLQGS